MDDRLQAEVNWFHAWLTRREAEVSSAVNTPMRAASYEVHHTGGGCLAWMRLLDEEGPSYLLITINDDITGDPEAREWLVGRYDGDSWICLEESFTLAEAIRVAALLPAPRSGLVQELYSSLAAALAANRPE